MAGAAAAAAGALRDESFSFAGGHTLTVRCRKSLAETLAFKATQQCDTPALWQTLEGFGGGWRDDTPPRSPAAAAAARAAAAPAADALGLDVWPAAVELAAYLAAHPALAAGRAVLELGAGVGLPGILAGRLGAARVVLTDYEPPVVAAAAANAAANGLRPPRVAAERLDWADGVPGHLLQGFDVVLLADVLYMSELLGALVGCVGRALAPRGVALVGHQQRRALVVDAALGAVMDESDRPLAQFESLCAAAGLRLRRLGARASPGFPGPLLLLALARDAAALEALPPAWAGDGGGGGGGGGQTEEVT